MKYQSAPTTPETGSPSSQADRVDMHCHCLPGIDDGPATLEEALDLCRLLVADGITTVIATPHQLGRYGRTNTARRITQSVETLRSDLATNNIPLRVIPGAEVRIDERILPDIESGDLLTLGDHKRYLLLELPKHTFVDPTPIIEQLAAAGGQVILAHPERLHGVMQSPTIAGKWADSGAILQVTAGSLLGDFGDDSQQTAWTLLNNNWVKLVATDAHSVKKRPPRMSAAIKLISQRLGAQFCNRICIENPSLIANGMTLSPTNSRAQLPQTSQTQERPTASLRSWANQMQQYNRPRKAPMRSPLGTLCRWISGSAPCGADSKSRR